MGHVGLEWGALSARCAGLRACSGFIAVLSPRTNHKADPDHADGPQVRCPQLARPAQACQGASS